MALDRRRAHLRVAAVSDVKAAIPDTYTFGLGTNNQIYEAQATSVVCAPAEPCAVNPSRG